MPASDVMPSYDPHLGRYLIFVRSVANATFLRSTFPLLASASTPDRSHRTREALGEQPLDVLEQFLGLVPPVEDTDAGRALSARVRRDDHRHLRPPRTGRVGRAQRIGHGVGAVENCDVDSR